MPVSNERCVGREGREPASVSAPEPGRRLSLDDAVALRERWREAGERVVLTNGCFDLLHIGHTRYLAQARSAGDRLVVALNDDASVRRLKGAGRPLACSSDRAELLCALRAVDAVVVFAEATADEVVRAVRPDVYAKGGDYDARRRRPPEADVAEACGGTVVYLPYEAGYSTSALIDRIKST